MNLGAGAVTAVAMQPRPCDVRVYQNPLSQAAPQVGSYIGISGSEFDRSGA